MPPPRHEMAQRLGQQSSLPDPRVTGEQHHPGPIGAAIGVAIRAAGGAEESLELRRATDNALGPAPVDPHIGHHSATRAALRHHRRFGRVAVPLPYDVFIRATRSCITWNM